MVRLSCLGLGFNSIGVSLARTIIIKHMNNGKEVFRYKVSKRE